MRHVALTTPNIWAAITVSVSMTQFPFHSFESYEESYAILAARAIEWLERAGVLPLTVIIQDDDSTYEALKHSDPHPTYLLFDALLSYSPRWKEFQFTTRGPTPPKPLIRMMALTAADVPMLQSISLCLNNLTLNPVLKNRELLTIPTLRHVKLESQVRFLTVNWAVLTSVALRGNNTENQIGIILQQTKFLEFCDVVLYGSDEHYTHPINLPFLKSLIISHKTGNRQGPSAHSILETITAPILEVFENTIEFIDLSLLTFLKRSPCIRKLSLLCFDTDETLMEKIEYLHHCPSFTTMSFEFHGCCNVDRLLQAFSEQGNDRARKWQCEVRQETVENRGA